MLEFHVDGATIAVEPAHVVVAGWTGRDQAAVQHHIDELAAIGVAPPSTVPLYYRVGRHLVTQDGEIDAVGAGSSGELEPVVVVTAGGLLLTAGSDHTDRDLEAHSVALSKAIAGKPVARQALRFASIDDLDALTLHSEVSEDGKHWTDYQRGTLASIRPLASLVEGARAALGGLPEGTVVFCGTLPTLTGAIVPARHFRGTISDPATDKSIAFAYSVKVLPEVS
ncbi:DUF2848 family protein [Acuticoccus kandeliae]|uniref:DUF2848 family protein n=1 Tax=Acuticoccus kandeliae TaxID=2073160 RepID=UPI001FE3B94F|nr:DUF2848 family protein [Acuticoccus kandeliae]